MKLFLNVLGLLLSVGMQGQTWLEKTASALTGGNSETLRSFLIETQYSPDIDETNDTILQISNVMHTLASDYYLGGPNAIASRRSEFPARLIILQPEVSVCILDSLNYRKVMSGRYLADRRLLNEPVDNTRGKLFNGFLSLYQEIPDTEVVAKYNYINLFSRNNFGLDSKESPDGIIVMDTARMMLLNKILLEQISRLNQKQVKDVLGVYFSPKKDWVSLSYDFLVDKMVFNKDMSVCVVQISTGGSAGETLLMRLDNSGEWTAVLHRTRIHVDYIYP